MANTEQNISLSTYRQQQREDQVRSNEEIQNVNYSFQELENKRNEDLNITLQKKVYGLKDALEILDEEFNEFALKKYSTSEFFNLYNKNFYEIEVDLHRDFIQRSGNYIYPEGYKNPTLEEIEILQEQINSTQVEIDSTERHLPYIKNGLFIMSFAENGNTNNPTARIKNGESVYYMQSGKKRKIKNYQTYLNLKTKLRSKRDGSILISDNNLINFLHIDTINKISNGPDLNKQSDININVLEINIYPRTLEDYNNQYKDLFLSFNESENTASSVSTLNNQESENE
jgi:hypothetical protein